MDPQTHPKQRLQPRLALRVGGLGNRKFGRENNIDEAPEKFEAEAAKACEAVFACIVKTLGGIIEEDRSEENVLPAMENEGRYRFLSMLGLLFGRRDRWQRRSSNSRPVSAQVFSNERPYLRVFTGDAIGGDTIIAETAGLFRDRELHMEVDIDLGQGAELVLTREVDLKSQVKIEILPITVNKPAAEPIGLGIGCIPDSPADAPEPPLSRADARKLTSIARQRALGYRAQSEALRHHSDILIAIWDEDAEGKAGGTSESVQLALLEHIPVIAIRFPDGKAQISVLRTPGEMRCNGCNDWAERLRVTLEELLCFPEEAGEKEHESSYGSRVAYAAFISERPLGTIWVGRYWKALDRWMKGSIGLGSLLWEWIKAPSPLLKLPSLAMQVWMGSDETFKTKAPPVQIDKAATQEATFENYYRPAKDRASKMSTVFGDAHRGGIIASYLLAAGAVLLALVGGICLFHQLHPVSPGLMAILALAEFFLIILLYALAKVSSLEDWHEAYTDARVLAEALRAMRYLGPLGIHLPLPRLPRHLSGDKKWPTMWTRWYFRALVRQSPLRVDGEQARDLQHYRAFLQKDWIGGGAEAGESETSQHAHHEANVKAQHRLERGIEQLGTWLFFIVMLAAFVHTIHTCLDCYSDHEVSHVCPAATDDAEGLTKPFLDIVLLLLCVGGPTTLAALQGLLSQLEARRLRTRSESLIANFAQRRKALANLILTDPDTHELADSAEAVWGLSREAHAIAMEMVDEAAGWSLIYKNADIHAG